MKRWSTLEGSIYIDKQAVPEEHFLKNFFENKAFIPKTEKEKQEYEDFSFISSAMALLVYVAKADGRIEKVEKEMILKELQFQLEQRHYEYKVLSEKFGPDEVEILNHLFDNFQEELKNNSLNLVEIIRIIDMIYEKNPYKRFFLIRLCYYIAYADRKFTKQEFEAIQELSKEMVIDKNECNRIEQEVKNDLKID